MDILIMSKTWPDVKILGALPGEILKSTCLDVSENIFFDEISHDSEQLMVIFEPIACLSKGTIEEIAREVEPVAVKIGDMVVATWFPTGWASDRRHTPLNSGLFRSYYLPAEESFIASTPTGVYMCTEMLQGKVNEAFLENGVFITDMRTAYISPTAKIGAGTVILPNCQIFGACEIGEGCKIGPNSYLENAKIGDFSKINASQIYESTVGENSTVGPFSYIRPGSEIQNNVKIGDFVEIKKSQIKDGAKVSHFAYIGDAEIGKNVNFSCGAITVNYDGKNKFKTIVGDNSFIGCNVNLVAPVEVGEGAFVAAGSTITKDVPENALAVAREKQYNKDSWADQRRKEGKL